ncbi:MAG TPA: hypothetical protein VMY35_19955 [Phycisphaerae bacterium]|nr:hypothetical protein [Phycisphaerae bacterium]
MAEPYTYNPDVRPILDDWLNAEPGDEQGALKHQARLLIERLESKRLMAFCIWCGKVFTGDPEKKEDVARIRREMQEHDCSCPENPLAIRMTILHKILNYVHFVLTDGGPIDGDLGNSVQLAADRIKAREEKAEAALFWLEASGCTRGDRKCILTREREALAEVKRLKKELADALFLVRSAETEIEGLKEDLIDVQTENKQLRAAIATPEVYAGVVSKVVEEERAEVMVQNRRLREAKILDEGLMRRALEALKIGATCQQAIWDAAHCGAYSGFRLDSEEIQAACDVLRARLGEALAAKEAKESEPQKPSRCGEYPFCYDMPKSAKEANDD